MRCPGRKVWYQSASANAMRVGQPGIIGSGFSKPWRNLPRRISPTRSIWYPAIFRFSGFGVRIACVVREDVDQFDDPVRIGASSRREEFDRNRPRNSQALSQGLGRIDEHVRARACKPLVLDSPSPTFGRDNLRRVGYGLAARVTPVFIEPGWRRSRRKGWDRRPSSRRIEANVASHWSAAMHRTGASGFRLFRTSVLLAGRPGAHP